jgi:DNA-binding NarL/FixJ family response regulator
VATFALIHGGGGGALDWHLVAPALREYGHDPVAVDLPKEDPSAGWSEYADTVVQAVGDGGDLVVVGHSLGAFTAPLVCARRPVELIVLVAGMIPSAGELFADWWKNTGYEATGYDDLVGEAGTGDDAVRLARSTRADVVLMDIRMPGMDGIAATQAITDDDDLAGVKVVVLTTFEIDAYVIDAVRAGASGFLSKSIEPADLLDAIRTVAGGDALLSPRATQALLAEFATTGATPSIPGGMLDALTTRERELTTLAAHGLSNDQIAEQLFLSPLTVKTHINRAMMKLAVRDRAQLVVLAYQTGLVRPGDSID